LPASSARSTIPEATVASIWARPVSTPTGAAPARQSLMPPYSGGLWLAVNIAAGASRCPDANQTRSVDASPRSRTSAPACVAPSMNAAASGSEHGRMSRPTSTRSTPANATNALPTRRATDSSSSVG
jgi:hypothetical protein